MRAINLRGLAGFRPECTIPMDEATCVDACQYSPVFPGKKLSPVILYTNIVHIHINQ